MGAEQLMKVTESISHSVESMRQMMISGYVDPIATYINMARVEKIIKQVKDDKDVKELALKEFEKYGEKRRLFGDCEVERSEVGVRYDFSECGDTILNDMYSQRDNLNALIKEREEALKILRSSRDEVDPETGEIMHLVPPSRSSKTTLKLTFKNK